MSRRNVSSSVMELLLYCFLVATTTIRQQHNHHALCQAMSVNMASPQRALTPPFPNGDCGGTIVEISPEETFAVDVNLANINILGDLVLSPRPIKIWLPPDYCDGRRVTGPSSPSKEGRKPGHPVLYVHDGQNAMDDSESWTGYSWRLMGALTRLANHGLLFSGDTKGGPHNDLPIVVLLPSAEGDLLPGIRRRHLEYGDINSPFSQAHADFVAKTVKPLVDNRFNSNPAPESTFAMGTSLGGQASLHLVLRHPDMFGGAACMSPAFGPQILQEVESARSARILRDKKVYLDIGGDKDDVRVPTIDLWDHLTPRHWWNPGYFWLDTQLQGQVQAMQKSLARAGVEQCCFHEFPGGRHNEREWSQRIHKPLLHLFS
jgi:pimeloyl-ACP methyl ester carboxylesterase